MSWLSSATGIHISKKGVKIEPLKALGTVATLGSFGAAGPLAGLATKIPGVAKLGSLASKIPGVSALGGFLKGHGADLLTGAQGLQAFGQQQGADKLRDKALGYATNAYDEKAPIRAMALKDLQNEQLPDLSSIYANSGNPYAKLRGVSPIGRQPL